MVWQLAYKTMEYTAFGTSTELHEEIKTEIEFPAVTVCNMNRYHTLFKSACSVMQKQEQYLWKTSLFAVVIDIG